MDYKEKYEMALEGIQEILSSGQNSIKMSLLQLRLQGIFPELIKESEDEKIRKGIISCVKGNMPDNDFRKKYIAWLEKMAKSPQLGELKPANKVKPKFKVGNWYQCTKDFFGKGVTFDKNTAYYCAQEGCLQDEYGCHIAIVKDLYDNFKLWTIQDARDGDILIDVCGNIGIYKSHNDFDWMSYCSLRHYGFRRFQMKYKNEKTYPATKEQCETLIKAMADAGYTFDFEKKELKKIEQKPAWSEEDEDMLNDAIGAVGAVGAADFYTSDGKQEIENWLKALKERVGCLANCTTTKEYVRADTLIEKACEWLRTHSEYEYLELISPYNYYGACNLNKKKMIEDFKNYMKGE